MLNRQVTNGKILTNFTETSSLTIAAKSRVLPTMFQSRRIRKKRKLCKMTKTFNY